LFEGYLYINGVKGGFMRTGFDQLHSYVEESSGNEKNICEIPIENIPAFSGLPVLPAHGSIRDLHSDTKLRAYCFLKVLLSHPAFEKDLLPLPDKVFFPVSVRFHPD
jgi:hypothetical protein